MQCLRRIKLASPNECYYGKIYPKGLTVSCDSCHACKERRIDAWSHRMREEQKRHDQVWFVTFTYANGNITRSPNGYLSLDKKDIKNWRNRVYRYREKNGLTSPWKYYLAGEYGTKFARPHYHAIIFGLLPGTIYATWGLGRVDIRHVNNNRIGYVCKYIDKDFKQHSPRDDRVRNFSLMSKEIGLNYVENEQVRKYHKSDITNIAISQNGYKKPLCRYYRNKIYNDKEKHRQAIWMEKKKAIIEKRERERVKLIYGEKMTYEEWKLWETLGKLRKRDRKVRNWTIRNSID